MPNWCNNTISLSGKTDALLAFLNKGRENRKLTTATDIDEALKDTYHLTDWIPVPDCVSRYDLTNYTALEEQTGNSEILIGGLLSLPSKCRKQVHVGDTIGIGENALLVTQEILDGMRADEKESMDKYGVVGWYDWNCKYLGTKWDADLCFTLGIDGELFAFVDTAWTPFVPWVTKVTEESPDLSFNLKYYEIGNMFCGEIDTSNGCINYETDENLCQDNAEYYGCEELFDIDEE